MAEIPKLRKRVDEIDEQLLLVLCERVRVCREIGESKRQQGKPVKDTFREKEVYKRVRARAAELGLDAGRVEAVYREIVNMCSAVQV